MFSERCEKDHGVDLIVMSITRYMEEKYALRVALSGFAFDLAVSEEVDFGIISSRRTDLLQIVQGGCQ